jgi:hypothetical protein
MKAITSAVLVAAITSLSVPAATAAVSTSDAVGACKARIGAELAPEGVSTRIKFRGTGRKNGATEIRMQVYPQGMDSFKATCTLDRQTGVVIAMSPESRPSEAIAQTTER